jgi:hypothetical protein
MQGDVTKFSEKVTSFFGPLGMEGVKVFVHGDKTTVKSAMDFLKQFSGQHNASDEQIHEAAKREWDTLRTIIRKRRRFIGVIGLIFITLLPLFYLIFNIVLFAAHWRDMQKPNR